MVDERKIWRRDNKDRALTPHVAAHTPQVGCLEALPRRRYKPLESSIFPEILRQATRRHKIMAVERTFSIIKPDATKRNLTGKVNAMLEDAGLRIVGQKRVRWSEAQAQKFYEEHKERPFYGELCEFMMSGPIVVQVLEGEGAILKNRDVMGATNPADADEGTIRKTHALSLGENSVHGSDSPESAAREIALNFTDDEIVG
ncbi:MAG: nucleoside-diphosphate kinase [Alphaproteobacteria bacterium]|jgi:nucleoside-diphosphate kinase